MTITVEAEGEFGVAVARYVRALLATSDTHMPALIRAGWRDVLAAPPDAADLADRAEPAASEAARTPWLPVVMAHPFIRVGPLMVPGQPPCARCLETRLRQHGDDVDAAIADSLRADPDLGVRGFAPHQAMIAAGLALMLTEAGEPGAVVTIDTRTDESVRWRLVAADGCPGCGEAS